MMNKELLQKSGLKRNTIDKFYTKPYIVELCCDYIYDNLKIYDDELIIEPSAGNGAFINGIKLFTDNYKFYDIKPDHKDIIKQDFLKLDYKQLQYKFTKIHIIGNPPFGRQSSLAMQFIKYACHFCDSISFILPKSFKKDSLKKTFPLNFSILL